MLATDNFTTDYDLKIDQNIIHEIRIPDYYGGEIDFEIYDSNDELIYNKEKTLNATESEQKAQFTWNIFDTTQTPGIHYLKSSWFMYNDTHAFVTLKTEEVNVSLYTVELEILDIETFTNNSIYGTEVLVGGCLTYEDTNLPVEGETIYVEILAENNLLIDTESDITNEQGIIQLQYELPEVE